MGWFLFFGCSPKKVTKKAAAEAEAKKRTVVFLLSGVVLKDTNRLKPHPNNLSPFLPILWAKIPTKTNCSAW
jgi:hypothetical protein